MSRKGYSSNIEDGDNMARAIGKELPISPKMAVEISRKLRGMMLEEAILYLEDVIAMRRPVAIRRYKTMIAHKRRTGPGRYPVKTAKHMLRILLSVQENAEAKDIEGDLRIAAIAAHKGQTTEGRRPRAQGRSTPWNQETVNLEVVVTEVE